MVCEWLFVVRHSCPTSVIDDLTFVCLKKKKRILAHSKMSTFVLDVFIIFIVRVCHIVFGLPVGPFYSCLPRLVHASSYSVLGALSVNTTLVPTGAGQKNAMFVHAQSFEDLTAEAEEARKEAEVFGSRECAEDVGVLVEEKRVEQLNIPSDCRSKEEDVSSEAWRSHKKHMFVLSQAGKPIYTRYGTEEALSSTMGVMMALVSFVEAENNIIRSIHAG